VSTKNLLLVEDEVHTLRMLCRVLLGCPSVATVQTAATYEQALLRLADPSIDVLVTDLQLPDGSGLDIIRQARSRDQQMPILVITVLGTERAVLDAISHGADGYLLKGANPKSIADALEALLAGEAPISPAIARHVLMRFRNLESDAVDAAAAPSIEPTTHLSKRETEILSLVGKGLKSAEIAEVLEIATHTVNTHIRNIYRKLEVASRTEAVYEARRMGLLGNGE